MYLIKSAMSSLGLPHVHKIFLLSHAGTIEVICIDSGDTCAVALTFVQTLDIPGTEAEHVREWPPLATKFILTDMVTPRGSCIMFSLE